MERRQGTRAPDLSTHGAGSNKAQKYSAARVLSTVAHSVPRATFISGFCYYEFERFPTDGSGSILYLTFITGAFVLALSALCLGTYLTYHSNILRTQEHVVAFCTRMRGYVALPTIVLKYVKKSKQEVETYVALENPK